MKIHGKPRSAQPVAVLNQIP